VRLRLSGLQVERLDVLPSLLQQRDQKVDGQHNVGKQIILRQRHVSDGNSEAKNLLQLESDGALELVDLGVHVIVVSDKEGEFTGLVKSRTQETGNLTNNSLRGEEGVVLGSKLLNQLLVLVQLLQIVDRQKVDSDLLSLIAVELISEDANLVQRLGDGGELHRARETLVLLGVVVLESDLELESLGDPTVLGLSLRGVLRGLGGSSSLSLLCSGEEGVDVLS